MEKTIFSYWSNSGIDLFLGYQTENGNKEEYGKITESSLSGFLSNPLFLLYVILILQIIILWKR